jgi:hypothetical protein
MGRSRAAGTFVLNERIYGLPFYHFHIVESFDELCGCFLQARICERKGKKEI